MSSLIKYVNACKIIIILPSCQPSKLLAILEYNIFNPLDLSSNNNKKDTNLRISNNGNNKIKHKSADTTSRNNRDID